MAELATETVDGIVYPREGSARRRGIASSTASLACLDAAVAVLVFSVIGRLSGGADQPHGATGILLWYGLVALAGPVALGAAGAYRLPHPGIIPIRSILLGAIFAVWLGWLALLLTGRSATVPELALVWCALGLVWTTAHALVASRADPERVLVVGNGIAACRFVETSRRHLGARLAFVGYVDDGTPPAAGFDLPRLGDVNSLPFLIGHQRIERIVVAFTRRSDGELLELVRRCDRTGVTVDIVPRFFDFVESSPQSYSAGSIPIISVASGRRSPLFVAGKRAIDIAASSVLLVLLAPLFAVIAVAIAIEDGRPVLFRQTRVGRGGVPFRIFKFRTMVAGQDAAALLEAQKLVSPERGVGDAVVAAKTTLAPRVTRVGRLLRRSSFDELPQLLNVFLGDMSLIGPRPLQQYEVDSLVGWQRTRLEVRPGMSGLWQVLGRSEISWEERLQLDYSYVRHASLRADAAIAARTLPAVVRGKGAR